MARPRSLPTDARSRPRAAAIGLAGIPYAITDSANSENIEWTDSGVGSYTDFHDPGDTALAMNDANVSVGQDRATLASEFATAAFSFTRLREQLKSLKSCTIPTAAPPMATGIDDSGTIVGYACDRAVEFSPAKYAAVLPVGAAGVSSAAQAVNAHGHVVGSVGNQAFLYRGRLTRTYLPRPPGESAGEFGVANLSRERHQR